MTLSTRQFLSDTFITLPFLGALISVLAQTFAVSRSVPVSDNSYVIRASAGFGPTHIGTWGELFVPFVILFLFFLANAFFAFLIFERHKLLSRFLAWFTLALSLLLLFYTYQQSTSNIML